jgi:hypothetical protein
LSDGLPTAETAGRNVGQIHVAMSSLAVLFKCRINRLDELCTTRLGRAASVYPEVAEVVLGSLACAEL